MLPCLKKDNKGLPKGMGVKSQNATERNYTHDRSRNDCDIASIDTRDTGKGCGIVAGKNVRDRPDRPETSNPYRRRRCAGDKPSNGLAHDRGRAFTDNRSQGRAAPYTVQCDHGFLDGKRNGGGKMTPIKSIRAKCVDCCCNQVAEVRLCESKTCALWPYRMGHRPDPMEVKDVTATLEITHGAKETAVAK